MNAMVSRPAYLSFAETVWISLVPAGVLALNGVLVLLLKALEVSVWAYLLLPAILAGALGWVVAEGTRRQAIWRLLLRLTPLLAAAAALALLHHWTYGSAVGSDSSYYYSHPLHSFFVSGQFTFEELPFVEYGDQPLANYWLPYNSEYLFAAIGRVLGLDFAGISILMHVSSNILLFLMLLAICARFCSLWTALGIWLALLAAFYGLHNGRQDIQALSAFRGFENKGLVFGFFYWASVNLFIPPRHSGRTQQGAAVLLGLSAFLVSGNGAFLVLPAGVLYLANLLAGGERMRISIEFALFAGALMLAMLAYSASATVDVYQVTTPELTALAAPSYEQQARNFALAWWVWAGAALLVAGTALVARRTAIVLAAFLAVAAFVQSPVVYGLFNALLPERGLIFWRLAALFAPWPAIVFSAAVLAGALTPSRFEKPAAAGLAGFAALLGVFTLPARAPYGPGRYEPALAELVEACPPGLTVLADRTSATALSAMQPGYRLPVGKIYFLNWQIANLAPGSPERERALDVRDASLFLSRSDAPAREAFARAVDRERPDLILARSGDRFAGMEEGALSAYERYELSEGFVLYARPGACRLG